MREGEPQDETFTGYEVQGGHRIIAVFGARGHDVRMAEAVSAYRNYSEETYAAGWDGLSIRELSDDELFRTLLPHVQSVKARWRAERWQDGATKDETEIVTAPADELKAALFAIIDENRELRAQIARLSEPAPRALNLTGATIMTRLTTGKTGEDGIAPA